MSDEPEPLKSLLAATSGDGKTGSLWSLAAAGFKLKIFDADRGTRIIKSALKATNQESLWDSHIQVESFTNKLRGNKDGYTVGKGSPKAWPDALAAMDKWPQGGSIYEWGPDTIVVIDSLTLFGRHALLYAMHVDNKSGRQPEIQHYGAAMTQLEGMMALLYSEDVRCHVLVLTHVTHVFANKGTKDQEYLGTFPSSLGKGLNDVIPRYFNNILTIERSGMGPGAKRYLSTRPVGNYKLGTKVEELSAKDRYPLTDGILPKPGLAEFFSDCGWPGPNGAPK